MRAFWLVMCAVLAAGVLAQEAPDELRLRNGTTLRGKAVAFDDGTVVFRTAEGLTTHKRADVAALFFGLAAAPGQLPPGLSAGEGLTVRRWATFHRITDHPPFGYSIGGVRISANGAKIGYWVYEAGLFTISPDGTGLTRVYEKRIHGLDLSADGGKVAWYGDEGLFVANADGSGRVKLPGGFPVIAMRLSADGSRLVCLSGDGVRMVATDGTGVRRIADLAQVARAAGTDENGNHFRDWRAGIDISDDASKIVFVFLWNGMALNGDGSGLRKVTNLRGEDNLYFIRVSGDGRKVAWQEERGGQSKVTIADWDGGNPMVYQGDFCSSGQAFSLSRDGAVASLGWGMRQFAAARRDYYNVSYVAGDPDGLVRPQFLSVSADGRRGVVAVEGPGHQLAVLDLNPPTLGKAPGLLNIRANPRWLVTDGTTRALLTCEPTDKDPRQIRNVLRRDGLQRLLGPEGYRGVELQAGQYLILNDRGEAQDAQAGDGVWSTNSLCLANDARCTPGPLELRLVVTSKANHGLIVDLDGLAARAP